MSKFVVAVLFVILYGYGFYSQAYAKSHFLKVSYIQSPASKSRLLVLKQQLKNDPKRYEQLRSKMLSSKIYHSLYIDLKSGEMVVVRDSFKVYPSVSVPETIEVAHKLSNDTTEVVDVFLGNTRRYLTPSIYGAWQIDTASEMRQILTYDAYKVKALNDPDKYAEVWITTEIQLAANKNRKSSDLYSCAPLYYMGLPGIVLEAENLFGSFKANNIEYLSDGAEFERALRKFKSVGVQVMPQQFRVVQKNFRIFASKILPILDALKYNSQSEVDAEK